MRYPLPHSYSFQIRRSDEVSENGNALTDARILSPDGDIVESIRRFDSGYEWPTCRLSAGNTLRYMLCNDPADSIKEKLGDVYDVIEKVALEMAGLDIVLCQSLAREDIMDCPNCSGTGKVPQVVRCPNYSGVGDHSCARCCGMKKIMDVEGIYPKEKCPICHGIGEMPEWYKSLIEIEMDTLYNDSAGGGYGRLDDCDCSCCNSYSRYSHISE